MPKVAAPPAGPEHAENSTRVRFAECLQRAAAINRFGSKVWMEQHGAELMSDALKSVAEELEAAARALAGGQARALRDAQALNDAASKLRKQSNAVAGQRR
jgi:peptidoglycan hydrolase CwlO-like protein